MSLQISQYAWINYTRLCQKETNRGKMLTYPVERFCDGYEARTVHLLDVRGQFVEEDAKS